MLRKKLQERLKQKEDQMSRVQNAEINESLAALGNTPAAKMRKAALMTKHMLEVEKFRCRRIFTSFCRIFTKISRIFTSIRRSFTSIRRILLKL